MNQHDIIRMARVACEGLSDKQAVNKDLWYWPMEYQDKPAYREALERFAGLVAAAEREACAEIVEAEALTYSEPTWAFRIVDRIRARGKA